MEGTKMDRQQTVLIVDGCEETCVVLQTVLQRREVRTLAARNVAVGRELALRHRPDVIVLDLDLDDVPDGDHLGRVFLPGDARATADLPRMILLGKLRRRHDVPPEGEVVAKPYHYAPLVRKIEGLLAARGQP